MSISWSSDSDEDFDDLLLPPPPEFADDPEQPQPPPTPSRTNRGSIARTSVGDTATAAPAGAAVDKKFVDEYLCDLTRAEALEVLEAVQLAGAYVVRPGSGSPYCISFVHCGEVKHVKIQSNNIGQYFLGDTKVEMFFDSMSLLMDYLTKNVIQGINGVVFRLIINAKPHSERILSKRTQPSRCNMQLPTQAQFSQPQPQPQPQPLPQQPQAQQHSEHSLSRRNSTLSSFGGGGSLQPETTMPRLRPLSQQRYFADVRRDEAEAHLMSTRIEGLFLVRPSKSSAYCLSVFHRGRVVHLKIVCVSNKFVLEQLMNDGQTYNSVPDLIDYLVLSRKTLTLMNGDSIVLRTN